MTRFFSYWAILISYLFSIHVFSHEEAEEELFSSSPEQIATLVGEPSYLVGGLISPLSGHPALRQTDMVVKGAQNIVLSRTYIPPHIPCSFYNHKHEVESGRDHLIFGALTFLGTGLLLFYMKSGEIK